MTESSFYLQQDTDGMFQIFVRKFPSVKKGIIEHNSSCLYPLSYRFVHLRTFTFYVEYYFFSYLSLSRSLLS